MKNLRNYGMIIGHLGREPKTFVNKDGSRKILMSVGVRQNYKNANGEHGTDWVDLEAFIPANTNNGVFELLKKGTMVAIAYTVVSNVYTDANGATHRKQVLRATNIELMGNNRKNNTESTAATEPEAMAEPTAAAEPETMVKATQPATPETAYQAPMPASYTNEFDADNSDFTEFNP